MSRKIRQDDILAILEKQGYATVKELVILLDYSSATVNRDLNDMQKRGLVKRSYGGVEAVARKRFPSLPFRYDLMKKEKRHIGKAAAALVEDGDTVFIDASTTAGYMGDYLSDKKDIHVITNNMMLAIQLAEAEVRVTVLGGSVVERPSMLAGEEAVEQILHYHADKMFFSTSAFTEDGQIADGGCYRLLHRIMMKCADRVYYLADANKLKKEGAAQGESFQSVTCVISNFAFPDATRAAFPDTDFLCVRK